MDRKSKLFPASTCPITATDICAFPGAITDTKARGWTNAGVGYPGDFVSVPFEGRAGDCNDVDFDDIFGVYLALWRDGEGCFALAGAFERLFFICSTPDKRNREFVDREKPKLKNNTTNSWNTPHHPYSCRLHNNRHRLAQKM
jgi:hypothetical protein